MKSKQLRQDIFREFNLQLIEQLSDGQSARLEELLGEDEQDEYLRQRLFQEDSPKKKIRKMPAPDFPRLLVSSKKTRTEIELTEAQLEDIKALRLELAGEPSENKQQKIEDGIKQILRAEQCKKLIRLTILKESARWGTVATLCGGSLGRFLELAEDDAIRLLETGVELNDGLLERIQQSKLDLWKDLVHALPPASQEKIMNLIGKPMVVARE